MRPIGYHNTFSGSSHASSDSEDLPFHEHTAGDQHILDNEKVMECWGRKKRYGLAWRIR